MELVLDRCRDVIPRENEQDTAGDYTSCRYSERLNGDYEQLNVVNPLQLGGLAPTPAFDYNFLSERTGFNGCIRNLIVNKKVAIFTLT